MSNLRRVVITGRGVISPLGNTPTDLWNGLNEGKSGVSTFKNFPGDRLPANYGAEAWSFTEKIDDFGPLPTPVKRQIRKGLKVMCREIKTGVAAAQLALSDSGLDVSSVDPESIGVVYGSDFIITIPDEFAEAVRACQSESSFEYDQWAESGLPNVTPLWLLKYLPNMPACHVAIYNDLRGPNNSLTVRESSSNLAISEAATTIARGSADTMIAGATGTRIHPLRTVHTFLQEPVSSDCEDPTTASRPFDAKRNGMVLGEGAAAVLLESLDTAVARNANILGEVVGVGSSIVLQKNGIADRKTALINSIKQALAQAEMKAADIGHVHAHGLSTPNCDRDEAAAIQSFSDDAVVVAAKSNFGNLGAASGMVEAIASTMCLENGHLFKAINYEHSDPECPLRLVTDNSTAAGDSFINLSVTPQGQASAVIVKNYAG